jgi:hypothetical protein
MGLANRGRWSSYPQGISSTAPHLSAKCSLLLKDSEANIRSSTGHETDIEETCSSSTGECLDKVAFPPSQLDNVCYTNELFLNSIAGSGKDHIAYIGCSTQAARDILLFVGLTDLG